MNRKRDVALILLAMIASAVVQFIFYLATQHWNIGWKGILSIGILAVSTLVGLVTTMAVIYKSIGDMDEKDREKERTENAKRDLRLFQATTKSLEDAFDRAIQRQAKAIIDAMHEPIDGHE